MVSAALAIAGNMAINVIKPTRMYDLNFVMFIKLNMVHVILKAIAYHGLEHGASFLFANDAFFNCRFGKIRLINKSRF